MHLSQTGSGYIDHNLHLKEPVTEIAGIIGTNGDTYGYAVVSTDPSVDNNHQHCFEGDNAEVLPLQTFQVWHSKQSKRLLLQQADHVPVFLRCKQQNPSLCGFLPLSPLLGTNNWNEKGVYLAQSQHITE